MCELAALNLATLLLIRDIQSERRTAKRTATGKSPRTPKVRVAVQVDVSLTPR